MGNTKESFLSFELNTYRSVYEEEIERRKYYSDKIQYALTCIVALFGADAFLFIKWTEQKNENIIYKFVSTFLIMGICGIAASIIIYFVKSLMCYNVNAIAPYELETLIRECSSPKYNSYSEQEIMNHINNRIARSYILIAKQLHQETKRHVRDLRRTYYWILAGVVLAMFTLAVIFLFG